MREGRELILATKMYAQDNYVKSWWYLLSTGFFFIVAIAGTLWNFHLLGKLLCSILGGLLMVRLFVIYHDYQHRAILSKSKLASKIMTLLGMYILAPNTIWKSSHNFHHSHNSKLRFAHIGSYPIMTKERFLECSRLERLRYRFMRHPLTILFGYFSVFIFGMCIRPFINDPKKHIDSLISFLLHVALLLLLTIFLGWQAMLLALIIPHFIASAIGCYLFYAQHNFSSVVFKDKNGWTYDGAALESSSFMKMWRLMHWFTGNIGYHHVHHLNPRIPFYRLPEVMRKIPELRYPKTTSLNPLEICRCLRLAVWDSDKQKMIALNQM